MKKGIFLYFHLALVVNGAMGQGSIDLTFTAASNIAYVQLDSIAVLNRTQGGDTMLYWPDTVLSIYYVGNKEFFTEENRFRLFQNYPNPVEEQTIISIYVPRKGHVSFTLTDLSGRMVFESASFPDKGKHHFLLTPGNGNQYVFTATWQGQSHSVKILTSGHHPGGKPILEYTGSEAFAPQPDEMLVVQDFSFNPGDELLFIGYAGGLQSGIADQPEEDQTYTFQFSTNIPCPGTPTVEYEGQVYHTIQIFSQCWLQENLNAGMMIPGLQEQTNNGILEKYCFNNAPDSCTKYGGLYMWNEMMQYTTQQGARGICPPDWHLPTDEEWKILEGSVDSQYGIADPEWDLAEVWRGYDAGKNLKSTSGWKYNGNGNNLFGFSGLPGGYRFPFGIFGDFGYAGYWWTSTEDANSLLKSWNRILDYNRGGVHRSTFDKGYGYSVRCIRDY